MESASFEQMEGPTFHLLPNNRNYSDLDKSFVFHKGPVEEVFRR
jgi:hypothetical protein